MLGIRQLYVALSRVRHLGNLTLERPVNYYDVVPNALNDRLKQKHFSDTEIAKINYISYVFCNLLNAI